MLRTTYETYNDHHKTVYRKVTVVNNNRIYFKTRSTSYNRVQTNVYLHESNVLMSYMMFRN